ncbi:helix-turn-helix domain-containing protein [Pseudoalteromonas tunicata]|uniref:helix-turn-helix domain-containing protein n=1 Tax=Pseudoalteromonas tunicata TaxID=314281 RepID=UPI00273EE5A1|nr:AraC family transcriptional regulator [Pseudoalteromonas tunicata]
MTSCGNMEVLSSQHSELIQSVNSHSNTIELRPGFSVSLLSAKDMGPANTKQVFPGDNEFIHLNSVIAGKFDAKVGNARILCGCGDYNIGYVSGESFEAYHSDDFCNLAVMITPGILNELAGEELTGIDPQRSLSFFLQQGSFNSKVAACAERVKNLIYEKGQKDLLLYSAVIDYLYWHLTAIKSHDMTEKVSLRERKQLIAARDFLLSDLSSPPTISDVAREVGINQCKLKKGFKALFNKTVYGCFQEERMQKAMTLLRENNVTETAISLGYSNISHFSVAFRKQFGVLPKEARMSLAPTLARYS